MKPIYLDYNATTPLDSRVLEKMLPYFQNQFGNPASASHQWGWAADSAVKKARAQIAHLLNAKESEIYFTASATESNNLAIFGLIRHLRREDPQAKIHFISTQVEHSSVRNTLIYARDFENVEVDFLPVTREGLLEISTLEKALKPHTRLISVIWVQNEIGSVQNMQEISQVAKENKIYLHSDATQAVGKIPVDMKICGVDMLAGSAHKFYGPKGVGFLYLRSQHPKVQIEALIFGGGQEKDLRAGTLNVPGIVGLGEAAELCAQNLAEEKKQNESLRDLLWQLLKEKIPGVELNGPALSERAPTNLSITFQGHHLDALLPSLVQLAVSSGSACHSGTWTSSPVLQAIGRTETDAQSTLRLSLGRGLTRQDIEEAAAALQKACEKSKT